MVKGMPHHVGHSYVQDIANGVAHVDITTHLNVNHGHLMDHAKNTTKTNVHTRTLNLTYRDGHSHKIRMTHITVPTRITHDPHPEIHTRNPGGIDNPGGVHHPGGTHSRRMNLHRKAHSRLNAITAATTKTY